MNETEKQQLRQHIRQQRLKLSRFKQHLHSLKLTQQLLNHNSLQQAKHIAFYIANNGEINPKALAQCLQRQGKTLYLPCLEKQQLSFKHFHHPLTLKANRFGIKEPANGLRFKATRLDLILMPLVAFDKQGNRIGMGGGFYDKSLSFKRHNRRQRPALCGLAHSLQEIRSTEKEPWDVPLDMLATEKQLRLTR